MANRIWIDVEDLFRYLKLGQRPSGIQRLEFKLCRALYVLPQSKGRVFFVWHDVAQQEPVAIPWEAVATAYTLMTSRSSKQLKAATAEPGDVLAVFEAAWVVSEFTFCSIERATHEGLRLALLIYDIILLRRPEWFKEQLAIAFRIWFGCILPLSDMIFTISAATSYVHSAELALRTPIPIGAGFKKHDARPLLASNRSCLPPADRDRVRREFKPVEWGQSVRAVWKLLDMTEDASNAAEPELRRRP